MSRHDIQRLADITAAITAIRAHLQRGEAVKGIGDDLLDSESGIPWAQIAAMRDRLAHRYFDTSHAIIAATITNDLPELDTAVARLTLRAVENPSN